MFAVKHWTLEDVSKWIERLGGSQEDQEEALRLKINGLVLARLRDSSSLSISAFLEKSGFSGLCLRVYECMSECMFVCVSACV